MITVAKEGKEHTGLSESDLDQHDKMSVKSFHKIIDPRVIDRLSNHPGTNATITFITIMKLVYDSYEDSTLSPLDRIKSIWCATFFLRVWHRWVQQTDHMRLDEHFITDNVELGVELNAHSLINYLLFCRTLNRPELFLPTLLNSQHNERSFANARSMTGVQNTVINFDMLEYMNKATRFEYLDELRSKLEGKISFSRDGYKQVEFVPFDFPSDSAIQNAVNDGKIEAQKLLEKVGLDYEEEDFHCALSSATKSSILPLTEINVAENDGELDLELDVEESGEKSLRPTNIDNSVEGADIIFEASALLSTLGADICKISKSIGKCLYYSS